MVQYCSVSGCSSRSRRDLVAFYRFPTVRKRFGLDLQEMIKLRREKWVNCIPRFKNVPEDKFKHARVCANHFISGKPAALQDVDDPDWVPSLNLRLEPRRVRLRRLAAAGPPPPLLPREPARTRPECPDCESDEGYRDVPNERLFEPEVEIEELDGCCRANAYGCPLCGGTFRLQDELRDHLNTHACVLFRAGLQGHWAKGEQRRHDGGGDLHECVESRSEGDRGRDRPPPTAVSCAHWDLDFPHPGRLAQHAACHLQDRMEPHCGVRPYRCHLCPLAFTQRTQLKRHLDSHAVPAD